jgi:hypothetical protein
MAPRPGTGPHFYLGNAGILSSALLGELPVKSLSKLQILKGLTDNRRLVSLRPDLSVGSYWSLANHWPNHARPPAPLRASQTPLLHLTLPACLKNAVARFRAGRNVKQGVLVLRIHAQSGPPAERRARTQIHGAICPRQTVEEMRRRFEITEVNQS